jgi:hypothetical protein
MITGTVNNSGVNNGSQAGNVISGGSFTQGFFAHGPLINGTVNNYGVNNGSQAGNVITGGSFLQGGLFLRRF